MIWSRYDGVIENLMDRKEYLKLFYPLNSSFNISYFFIPLFLLVFKLKEIYFFV